MFKSFLLAPEGNKLIIEPMEDSVPEGIRDENIEIYDNGEGVRFKKGFGKEELEYAKNILKALN